MKWPFAGMERPNILCVGSHCDDIEIGCGGTLLRVLGEYPKCHVDWVVFSSNLQRRKEAKRGAGLFLKGARSKNVVIRSFRDGFFPYDGARIKKEFEALKRRVQPDLIFTHYRNDLHQDHRIINELTWNTFRNHLVLEYEIPKYDGDFSSPNAYFQLPDEICRQKIAHLHEAFPSQRKKHWFQSEIFLGLMRLRGMESAGKYAEGFYIRKLVL